ncbi:DUF262 domain-containing protein [Amycolatopsis rhabdoformis]|uniref:DUF262 domain-containing protein n=1 Tax=Amycolatopsis rhabdoformis TaxID=1448059 RepID=A0ABZ1HXQ7_9PSEU|nr:DUF262 domain-containing protein [Amycolatopsis rhabdoformis]WSE26922.1 DUF262 domain-containing protein [Amycolatopsis rhabdoformis]
MNSNETTTLVKPEVILLENLLREIAEGRLRVPKFQRPFVWRPEQMTQLFDSIDRSYPIGSLLIWETNIHLASLDQIADFPIPAPPTDGRVAYLLDGHQRLSTLFGCLRKTTPNTSSDEQHDWLWEIYRVLGESSDRNQFQHWKKPTEPPENYLPMRSVLRTMDFLTFARRLQEADKFTGRVDLLIDEAEELAQRFKSYQMATVRLVGGDLKQAVTVFSRLNSSGQSMSPDQMVSALTYQNDDTETLADRIKAIQEDVDSDGFGTVAAITVFRSILAVAGEEDVQEARWEVLAERIGERLAESVDKAAASLRRAVAFLKEDVGVPLARLIPYNAQIMLLVAFFNIDSAPSDNKRNTLGKWFWTTSWSGYFAGANTTQIKFALQEMKDFASGTADLDLNGQVARPFPDRFDMRSARIRSFLIWELQRYSDRLDHAGEHIDAVGLLAKLDTGAYRHVMTHGRNASSPANRVIMPTLPGFSIKRTLLDLSGPSGDRVFESHGIPTKAVEKLRGGDTMGFIKERANYLASEERAFISGFGVPLSKKIAADADIDTE